MAEHDEDAPQGAHGPALAGGKSGKGGGPFAFVKGPHRSEIMVVCSVVGVVLAYLTLKSMRGGSGTAAASGATSTGYGYTSAAQAGLASSGSVAGFDQAAADGLNSRLSDQAAQLTQIGNALTALPAEIQSALPTPIASSPTPAPATSNLDWINQAVSGWVGQGGNAVDMEAALTQWTNGQAINPAQSSGVNWAVGRYGMAPQGTSGVSPIAR